MALEILHEKVSLKSDGQDPTLIQPSDWNEKHKITVPAESLVGRAQGSEGDAEAITIGAGLSVDAGTKVLSVDLDVVKETDIVVGTAPDPSTDMPNYRVLADNGSITWDKSNPNEVRADIAASAVGLAEMESSVQGELFVYGAAGAPTRLAAGAAGKVLVAGGAGVTPVWQHSGAPHLVLQGRRTSGTSDGNFASGAWRTRSITNTLYDPYSLLVSLTTNKIRLVAGTYIMEWIAPAYRVSTHQTRLINVTDNDVIHYGSSMFSDPTNGGTNQSIGIARFTIAANKDIEIQHQCNQTHATGFGVATGFGTSSSEVFTSVRIWKAD